MATGAGDGGDDGLEDAGDGLQDLAQAGTVVLLGGLGVLHRGGTLKAAQCHDLLVDGGDVGADDHLILAAGIDDRQHALGLFQHIGLGFGVILQGKAQPGGAVYHLVHVFLAAHIVQNGGCKLFEIHEMFPPFIVRRGLLRSGRRRWFR